MARNVGCAVVWIGALGILGLVVGPARAQATDPAAAQDAFFAGLYAKGAGDCEGAIASFEHALARDPGLHQTRLYLAECLFGLGQSQRACDQLAVYVDAGFPGAEVARARSMMEGCGGEPEAAGAPVVAALTSEAPAPEAPPPEALAPEAPSPEAPAPAPPAPAPAAGTESPPPVDSAEAGVEVPRERAAPGPVQVRIDAVAHVAHHVNEVALTTVGPGVGVHVRPLPVLDLGLSARLGLASHDEHDGAIGLPLFALSVAAAIPIRTAEIDVGVAVPAAISRLEGRTGIDVGVAARLAARVGLGASRLTLGAAFEVGHLVRPMIGGAVVVGIRLGRRGG